MLYPMIATFRSQSLYRITATLTKEIVPDLLQKALLSALERMPYFKVMIKSGFFRYYFQENFETPPVVEDNGVVLKALDFRKTKNFPFQLSYHKNVIFYTGFHCLTDGMGVLEFLKAILYFYLKEIGENPIPDGNFILTHPYDKEEEEDAFLRYYKKDCKRESIKGMMGENALGFDLTKPQKKQGLTTVNYYMPADLIKAKSKEHNTTVTIYLGAILARAIRKTMPNSKLPLMIFIPVNLRSFFPSITMRNFTMSAVCKIPKDTPDDLNEYIKVLSSELERQTERENMQIKLNYTSTLAKTPFVRLIPMGIKAFFARFARMLSKSHRQTIIFSNLGRHKIQGTEEIKDIIIDMNCNFRSPRNCGFVTYGDKTVLTLTRLVKESDVELEFAKGLIAEGIIPDVTSNERNRKYDM